MTSFSPDGFLISSTALGFALLTRRVTPVWSRVGLAGTLLAAAALKVTYAPLLAFIFAQRARFTRQIVLFAGLTVFAIAWIALFVDPPDRLSAGIDPGAQLQGLLAQPLNVFTIAWTTLTSHPLVPFRQVFVFPDHSLTHASSEMAGSLLLLVLAIIALEPRRGPVVSLQLRTALLGAAIVSVGLVYAAMYVGWTPVGSPGPISGVQGRYFLPIVILSLAALPSVSPARRWSRLSAPLAVVALCTWTILALWSVGAYNLGSGS